MTANTLLVVNNLLRGDYGPKCHLSHLGQRSEITGSVELGGVSAVEGPDLPLCSSSLMN